MHHLVELRLVDEWPNGGALLQAVPHHQFIHSLTQAMNELVEHVALHQDAICTDTRLHIGVGILIITRIIIRVTAYGKTQNK